jgi:hypothetical protein
VLGNPADAVEPAGRRPVISLLCIVMGFLIAGPLSPPAPPGCPGVAACTNVVPVYWLQSGLCGLVCAVALIFVTTVVEAIVWITAGLPGIGPVERPEPRPGPTSLLPARIAGPDVLAGQRPRREERPRPPQDR